MLKTFLAVAISVLAVAATTNAQQRRMPDSEYISQALSAGPPAVAKDAAVVRMESNGSCTLFARERTGSPA